MIRLTDVRTDANSEELVLGVLRSGHLAQGPMVAEFESQFATIAGTSHALATNSGTTALVLALEALSLAPGDEVITSAFTFVATLNAILEAGATARIVDINLADYTMDPQQVADAITPKTKAIMPVHLYGCPADLLSIREIAGSAELPIVEDAAQAHGGDVEGKAVGSWGVGCFSFYATKNITTGEGGMLTTDDDSIAERARLLRNQGMRIRYQYELPGHNYRLTDLQAALGIAQLQHLRSWTTARQENAAALTMMLKPAENLTTPGIPSGRSHVFHQYTVMINEGSPLGRDDLSQQLLQRGIESGIYYPRPVHDYSCYQGHPRVIANEVPNSTKAAARVLSLPVHQWLTSDEVATVANEVLDLVCH